MTFSGREFPLMKNYGLRGMLKGRNASHPCLDYDRHRRVLGGSLVGYLPF